MRSDELPSWPFEWERPRHRVTIGYSFHVGKYPITTAEWRHSQIHAKWQDWTGTKPENIDLAYRATMSGAQPAVFVNWHDAQNYCKWLSKVTGRRYRLLSEAEWEYCCRAGTQTAYWFGDRISTDLASYDPFVFQESIRQGLIQKYGPCPVAVGQFPANGFGLRDMHGTIGEWCEDDSANSWYLRQKLGMIDYSEAPTGGAPRRISGASSRVVRGGSFLMAAEDIRSASRHNNHADARVGDIGFRVAREG